MTAAAQAVAWHTVPALAVAQQLGSDPDKGLAAGEAAHRLAVHGTNALPQQPPPSPWVIAVAQVAHPMNLMLITVAALSVVIGRVGTGLFVGALVLLNVALGTMQELKARASISALAQLQVPAARVVRDGRVHQVEATTLVPGDVVRVEAGDVIPADGRILSSATLEVAEAALTGESAPVAKSAGVLQDPDTALGDRENMVFQSTSVTRGTASIVVTDTGSDTEMGKIAEMLTSVERVQSPLQRELNDLTRILGVLAWTAVAAIVGTGVLRGLELNMLVLLGVATAIAAIPTGLPTFVQGMLSAGAHRLAAAKAVVRNLTDVETLGSTNAINSDKTGTLTLNEMTAVEMLTAGHWFRVEGRGYQKSGAVLHAAGRQEPDFTPLAYGLALCSDATVTDDGTVVGDPTEAALVVLAAKLGVDAEISRRELPRIAAVPFDSEYKFMATYHLVPDRTRDPLVETVKGAPDVLLARCTHALWRGGRIPIAVVREQIEEANAELAARGLRVLAFAVRTFGEAAAEQVRADPMGHVQHLTFVSLVGIIDPLRPSAKQAVEVALQAGIDVRMITGDHALTARAIADELGLGPGVTTGTAFARASDDQLLAALPGLHVLGRVTPEDKLRLVDLLQRQGLVVAMTGDAVNDAAALKKADIGVAMGSGSEVSKQAARMVLTDDNFATLVRAIELGRDVYGKINAYLRYQLTGMFGVLLLMVAATIFDINDGIALTPGMLLFTNMFIGVFPVVALISDGVDPDIMSHPPRDPSHRLVNRHAVLRWLAIGAVIAAAGIIPLVWGPDQPLTDGPSAAMTMAFAATALASLGVGWVARRDPAPSLQGPPFPYLSWLAVGVLTTVVAVHADFLQRWLATQDLTGGQWLAVVALALMAPVVAAADKQLRYRRTLRPQPARESR